VIEWRGKGGKMDKLNIPAEFQDIIKTCLDNGFFDLENLEAAVQSGQSWPQIVDLLCYEGDVLPE
jgi:hypothetical protein